MLFYVTFQVALKMTLEGFLNRILLMPEVCHWLELRPLKVFYVVLCIFINILCLSLFYCWHKHLQCNIIYLNRPHTETSNCPDDVMITHELGPFSNTNGMALQGIANNGQQNPMNFELPTWNVRRNVMMFEQKYTWKCLLNECSLLGETALTNII